MQKQQNTGKLDYRRGHTTALQLLNGTLDQFTHLKITVDFELPDGGQAPTEPNDFAGIAALFNEMFIQYNDDGFGRRTALDHAVITANDFGTHNESWGVLPTESGVVTYTIPIAHICTNTDLQQLAGLDLIDRNAKEVKVREIRAELNVSWADGVNSLYGDPGDMTIKSVDIDVIQTGHTSKRSLPVAVDRRNMPRTRKANRAGVAYDNPRPIIVNPFMRDFDLSEVKFPTGASASGVEVARLDVRRLRAGFMAKGFIFYTHNGGELVDEMPRTLTAYQGSKIIGTYDVEVLASQCELLKGARGFDGVHYLPFSSLMQHEDNVNLSKMQDDIIFKGTFTGQAGTAVRMIVDGMRQEKKGRV